LRNRCCWGATWRRTPPLAAELGSKLWRSTLINKESEKPFHV